MVNKIETSNMLGQCSAGCNPKFLIHFRRPINFDESQGYGFDWFRPEYEQSLTRLLKYEKMIEPLYFGKIRELKKLYECAGVSKIKPYGKEYIPSIISMFSDIDEDVSDYIRGKQANGLTLDIETYQLSENEDLMDNGITIEFFSENEAIEINPSEISLSSLIANGKAKDYVRSPEVQISRTKEVFYRITEAINIKVVGSFLEKNEEIKIIAHFSDGSSQQVGQSVLYPNNVYRAIRIQPVKMQIHQTFNLPKNYKESIEAVMAQALIIPIFEEEEDFNIDINVFDQYDFKVKYLRAKDEQYISKETVNEATDYLYKMRDDILKLYNQYSPNVNTDVEDNHNRTTYLIFTDLKSGSYSLDREIEIIEKRKSKGLEIKDGAIYSAFGAGGVTSQIQTGNGWGNATIIYFGSYEDRIKDALNTANHELAHSLGLNHIFETGSSEAKFHQATTDNLMDYSSVSDEYGTDYQNPFSGKYVNERLKVENILNKFQWEIMHEDQSIILGD